MEKHDHEKPPHEDESVKIGGYGSSFQIRFQNGVELDGLRAIVVDIIKSLVEALMKRGAKGIGHIKLYIKGANGHMHADTLGLKYGVNIEGHISGPETSVFFAINVIALGMEKEAVAAVTLESLYSVAERNSFSLLPTKADQ